MKRICIALTIATCSLTVHAVDNKNINDITKEEFIKLQSSFVKSGCNVDGILRSAKELGVSPNYYDENSERQKKIESLSQDSLCLLSRSYYVVATYKIYKNGKEIEKTSDKYPETPNAVVTEIQFRIPPKMAKECDDNAAAAFFITFSKVNGMLQRKVSLFKDLLPCNESMLDVSKSYKYKKGNN